MTHVQKTNSQLAKHKQFGRFQIERLLGEGGFASVYLALDPRLDRHVALKVPKPSMLESSDAKIRFAREAKAAAMLSHPSIVPVFECGELEGQNFIASAYCPGQTLASWIGRQPKTIDLRTAARIIAELAEAVGYAHQRGIIHRDLKPANVLIDGEERISKPALDSPECETETIAPSTKREDPPLNKKAATLNPNEEETILPGQNADAKSTRKDPPHRAFQTSDSNEKPIFGKLRITDFGLAKSTSENQELTVEGTIMGTPSYMSPEQAAGRADVGPASDIFTLGTMLFELIVGEVPFRRESTMQTMIAITDEPLPRIDSLRKNVPRDLKAICQKSMKKEASERYASAFDFASDLNAWLDGRPVKARISGSIEKFTKACKRNPGITAAITASLLSLTLGLAATTWSWQKSEANLEKANFEFARAEENAAQAIEAAKKSKRARDSAEKVATFMTGVFRSPDPSVKGRDVKVIDILGEARERLHDSFGDDPQVRMDLMMAIGDCYYQIGEFKDSLAILEEANEFRTANLDDDRDLKLQIDNRLAKGKIGTRELKEAIELLHSNLLLSAKLEGVDSAIHATTELNLAAAHIYNREHETALSVLEHLLGRIDNISIEPAHVLNARNMLAACYGELGRGSESVEMFEKVLEKQKELLGEDHPSCLETANNLAVEYSQQGQRAKAAEKQEFILEQSRYIHGDKHPITLRCINNLAMSYYGAGNFEESTPLYREVYHLCVSKLGAKHANTLSVGVGLGSSLIAENELEEAIDLLKKIRKPLINAVGASDGRSRRLLISLSDAYERTDQLPHAIEAVQALISTMSDEEPGSAHECSMRATVVRLLLKDDQKERAEEVALELHQLIADLEDSPGYRNTLANLTLGLAKTGNSKMDEAGEFLEYVLSRRNGLQKFSNDENAILKPLLELLVETLRDVDTELRLFDPEEWESVLDSIEAAEQTDSQ